MIHISLDCKVKLEKKSIVSVWFFYAIFVHKTYFMGYIVVSFFLDTFVK